MKSTDEYINEAKRALEIESDNAFAKWLGVTRAALSNYKGKKSVMDDYVAARVAEALHISPLEVIATANAEREKDTERKDFWKKMATGAQAAVVGSTLIFGGLTYGEKPSNNQHFIHYAQWLLVVVFAFVLIWRKHAKETNRV